MSPAPEKEWFAIRTQPRKEMQARLNYENQGLTVYLPLMRTVIRHARRRQETLRPVFPGYLFLHLSPDERDWTAIASTRGAVGAVHFGDLHVPVPDWIIDGIKQKEDASGVVPLGHRERITLTAGDTVQVTIGDQAETPAIFCTFQGKDNVVVLLNFLQRQVKTTLHISQVRSVS